MRAASRCLTAIIPTSRRMRRAWCSSRRTPSWCRGTRMAGPTCSCGTSPRDAPGGSASARTGTASDRDGLGSEVQVVPSRPWSSYSLVNCSSTAFRSRAGGLRRLLALAAPRVRGSVCSPSIHSLPLELRRRFQAPSGPSWRCTTSGEAASGPKSRTPTPVTTPRMTCFADTLMDSDTGLRPSSRSCCWSRDRTVGRPCLRRESWGIVKRRTAGPRLEGTA